MKLDLILDDEFLALSVDGLAELGRNGVMSSLVLRYETLVPINALVDGRLLYGPLANILPFLLFVFCVFLCMGCLPPCLPVVCELF